MEGVKKNAIDILLAEGFKDLAKKKSIEKITIKEITMEAGVIRPTFYNHFQDKYELLEWIVKTDIEKPMRESLKKSDFKSGFIKALERIEEDKGFYKTAVRLEGQNSFGEILEDSACRLLLEFMDEKPFQSALSYSWMKSDMIGRTYGSFVARIVIDWIKNDMAAPKEELYEVTRILLKEPVKL